MPSRTVRSFQLPLSGSRKTKNARPPRKSTPNFQLPLSGSLATYSPIDMRPLLSTPSLGITGEESRPRWPRSWEPAFNSLSRDHRESSRRDRRCGRFPLSTPSLGITAFGRSLRGALTTRRIGTFNSLSRDHRHLLDHQSIGLVTDFQLPLSGSRGNPSKSALKAREQATFNSLSRDHFPSRAELLMEVSKAFQLPLSGSPSPIPGFFGSPRRPAAAPLRTNES